MLSREQIMQIIPHRDPFLFLDEIVEYQVGKKAVGRWKLTGDEFFFKGHFPQQPTLPGVLIVEALAQTGAVTILSMPAFQGKVGYFAGIDNVRFKRKVVPGDELMLTVDIDRIFKNIGYGLARATVNGEKAASGKLTFAVGD